MGLLKTLQSSAHPTQSLIPQGADWLTDSVTLVDPKSKVIITKSGAQVNYDYLVVATGIKLDWDSVPGLKETLGKNGVSSNYDVQQTAINLAEFKGGKLE